MGDPCGFEFFWGRLSKKRAQFFLGGCDRHRNYGMVHYLTLKSHQEKGSYPDEGWIFIGRFKVRSVPGMSVALEASKKSIKTHQEYDVRPLIK